MDIPYASATSGVAARREITRILRRFGCSAVGFMDDFDGAAVILQFQWRDRPIQMRASAKGWASAWLKANPWTPRRKKKLKAYNDDALRQGMIAVNSILRDWVKGQVTAVETGIMTFDHAFLPHMIGSDGRQGVEYLREHLALPAPVN